MSIFSRRRGADDGDKTAEQDAETDLPVKPASRPSAGGAVPNRPGPVPAVRSEKSGGEGRPAEARPTEVKMPELSRPADMARRLVDAPSSSASSRSPQTDTRKLTVGKEISLQGEINSCDHLVVEGTVGANLSGCREVEIMESGVYKGSAEIEQIEVRGLFEGTLNVRGRLLIRSTGKVTGTVRYGQIEIEIGGQISGDVLAQPVPRSNSAEAITTPAGIL